MNTFGQLFRVTTWGESHGKALGCVIDGCPPDITLSEEIISTELQRRKPGQSDVTTARKEDDIPEILSGVFKGKTTGHPISVIVKNKDHDSSAYDHLENVYRPGHADKTYQEKYGIRDHRGSGRASGRETVARVIAGSVAKQILKPYGIEIYAYAKQIGSVVAERFDPAVIEKNIVRTADQNAASEMEAEIHKAIEQNDSIGGIVEIIIRHCPSGIGEPVFHKLKADFASALMSIGAVMGVEYGVGFGAAIMYGSEMNDEMTEEGFTSNNHGGMLGGISTGEDIVLSAAIKPTSSIAKTQKTVTKKGEETTLEVTGRHDPCLLPRIIPVMDNMIALVLADHVLLSGCYKNVKNV